MAKALRCVGALLESHAITAATMGQPYAFVGGMVDLAPEQAKLVVVGTEVTITVELDGGLRVIFDGTFGPEATWAELLRFMRAREEAYNADAGAGIGIEAARADPHITLIDDIPPGTVDAFEVWLREQGVEVAG